MKTRGECAKCGKRLMIKVPFGEAFPKNIICPDCTDAVEKESNAFKPGTWEDIPDTTEAHIFSDRLKIPGGWVLRTCYNEKSVHTLFINDPNHEWRL